MKTSSPCTAQTDNIPPSESSSVKYLVHMDVNLPADLPAAEAAEIKTKEKAYSQALQHSGKWPEIWRVVGEYANYSIFDVDSNDELHEILQNLPLFPFMDISVVPLAKHPSDIK
jgi:muconolactone D-isomerase